jgi:ATP-dependent Clp protease ATP-binding subunit ClpB
MTSNIGSPLLLEGLGPDGDLRSDVREAVLRELRSHFRPEFLNRVDDVVLFKPLTFDEISRIVELLLDDLRRRLADRRIDLEMSEAAREHVVRAGYDPVFGARPLKRYLQHQIETRVGRALVAGNVSDGATLRVDLHDGELTIDGVPAAESARS